MPKPIPDVPITDETIMEGLEKDYKCPACAKILCHTVITSCGTKICRYCFVTSLKDNRCCPICRKRGCRDFKAYPQLDARIAANYNKVSRALRDDRQVFINRRKLLQQKFDLEAHGGAGTSAEDDDEDFPSQAEIKWKLMEEKLRAGNGLEPGSPEWAAARKSKRTEILKDIEKSMEKELSGRIAEKKPSRTLARSRLTPLKPIHVQSTPSKKSLVGKTSSISFISDKSKMANKPKASNSKIAIKPHVTTSMTSAMLSRAPSKFKNLASVNQANDKLGQELTNTYDRFLSAAEKRESAEQEMLGGSGDQVKPAAVATSMNRLRSRVEPAYEGHAPIFHALDREYSSRHDLDVAASAMRKNVRPRRSEVFKRIPQETELLEQIEKVKTFLKKTAFEELRTDMSVQTFTTGENPGSRLAHHMLKNVLEIQAFLQKRAKSKEDNRKDQETQTEARWCEFFGSAATILKQKCSTTSVRSAATATPELLRSRTRPRK